MSLISSYDSSRLAIIFHHYFRKFHCCVHHLSAVMMKELKKSVEMMSVFVSYF